MLEGTLGCSVESLIGTNMVDFIHPNEANQIQMHILQYASEKGNKGKMITCTMKSVMSMGKYVHSSQKDRKMESYNFAQSIESDHQLTDIRLELIGDGMMLCFFHAVGDRSKDDNNQIGKTQWTNWCDTTLESFDDQGCQSLWQHIYSKRMLESSSSKIERHQSGFPIKVFQILSSVKQPKILFSWPPPRLFDSYLDQSNISGTERYNDGCYFADIFARSTFGTDFREENLSVSQRITACTQRQTKAITITADGLKIEFEAMVIPHGELRFAVFSILRADKVNEVVPLSAMRQNTQPSFSTTSLGQEQRTSASTLYPQQANQTFPMTISSFQSMAAAPNPFFVQTPQMFYNLATTRMIDNADLSEYGRRASSHVDSITNQPSTSMASNTFMQMQPNRPRNEQGSKVDLSGYGGHEDINSSSYPIQRPRPQSISYFESPGKRCLTCGTSKSPEWRKGPDGNKSLCNACGLRFSRNASRQKKKEEKARNAAEVAANGGVIPVHLRRKFEAERDRKKVSVQKPSQSTSQQQQQQQQPTQMDVGGMTTFADFSSELDKQLTPFVLGSSSQLDNDRTESESPIESLIPDYNMDINEDFT